MKTMTSSEVCLAAISRPLMSPLYSATLFVACPKNSLYSSSLVRCSSHMTTPIAAGPGLPRAPPSVLMMMFFMCDEKDGVFLIVIQGLHAFEMDGGVLGVVDGMHEVRSTCPYFAVKQVVDRFKDRDACERPAQLLVSLCFKQRNGFEQIIAALSFFQEGVCLAFLERFGNAFVEAARTGVVLRDRPEC